MRLLIVVNCGDYETLYARKIRIRSILENRTARSYMPGSNVERLTRW